MSLTSNSATGSHYRRRDEVSGWVGHSTLLHPASYFRWKGIVDMAIAIALLIPVSIAVVLLVLLVRMTSKGPAIYRQIRLGKNGHRFMIYKIRTMRIDAEAASGPVWTQARDPRVTFLGRILRKLHLDELPQLFNVLRGEMSFVGPRPERPEFVRVLSESIPHYRGRIAVRPGITGLAQVNLPPDSDLTSVRRKVVLDLDYVERGNLWLDVRLMLCTALRIFKVDNGALTTILGLGRSKLFAALNAPADHFKPEDATPEGILLQASQAAPLKGERDDGSDIEGNLLTFKKPR